MTRAVRHRTLFVSAEAALAFAGAGIAGTLWRADQLHQDVPCSADGGCEIVAASAWSHINLLFLHHVPVALLGLLGYVLLLSLAMLRLGTDNERLDSRLHMLIALVSGGGFLYSWYLQWVAHAEIGAFCLWCRSSAFVMTALFGVSMWEWLADRRPGQRRQEIHG
jgi:uncharacterized membrane protein